jgi:hypothetical protein
VKSQDSGDLEMWPDDEAALAQCGKSFTAVLTAHGAFRFTVAETARRAKPGQLSAESDEWPLLWGVAIVTTGRCTAHMRR